MCVAIRAASERTAGACERRVRAWFQAQGGDPESHVVVVRERPFARAVRATLENGRDSGRAWVVALDADVMLLEEGLTRMAWACAAADGLMFAITPLVLCKFYGGFCCKGVHAYPRRLLSRALDAMVRSGSESDLRPEGAMVRAMEAGGWRAFGPPLVVGAHDYEQHFRHIYLKARLRARREAADAGSGECSLAFVMRNAPSDADMLVASWGMEDGRRDALRAHAPSMYAWDAPYPEFEARLRAHGLSEKPSWTGGDAGFAEGVVGAHDFAADARTPKWIRERLEFAGDRRRVLERIGVPDTRPAPTGRQAEELTAIAR